MDSIDGSVRSITESGQNSPSSRAIERNYMPQLDALRTFAVIGVLATHYIGNNRMPRMIGELDPGNLGVRLFFVLSGFLITGILLDCRDAADFGGQRPGTLVRKFYIRRFLRIFPIYYLVIGIALVVGAEPVQDLWPWLISYTHDFYVAVHDNHGGIFGHFWSLAVEEQFYLVWPWIVLYLRRQWLIPAICLAIALGPLFRLFAAINFSDVRLATLPFANLDSLGAGALLALTLRQKTGEGTARMQLARVVLPVGVLSLVVLVLLAHYRLNTSAYSAFGPLSTVLIFSWLVASASQGFRGLPGKLLELKPLTYAGKISYGVYVYHLFVPSLLAGILGPLGLVYPSGRLLGFLLPTAVTVCIAAASWHLFERPINSLKRRHSYTSYTGEEGFHPVAGRVEATLPSSRDAA